MSVAVTVIGAVFWTVAAFLWLARRDERRALAQLEGLALSRRDSLRDGAFSAVSGVVESERAETDPATGEAVAYYEARLERVEASGRRVLLHQKEAGERLQVDGVAVSIAGTQIELAESPPVVAEGVPNQAMRSMLEDTEHALPPADELEPLARVRWELTVRRIPLGATYTLLGTARTEGEPRIEGLPRLSPLPLEALVEAARLAAKAMDRVILATAAIGLAAFVVAAGLVSSRFVP